MSFYYAGQNAYMDHMQTASGGFLIFRDVNNYYNCGIARDAGSYKTVGLSFELGGLVDGTPPSTRSALLDSIMKFFGVNGPGVEENRYDVAQPLEFGIRSITPNPFKTSMRIAYSVGRPDRMMNTSNGTAQKVSINIYDVSGRVVKSFRLTPDALRATQICWDGKDDLGRFVPAGVYFIRLSCDDKHDETKVIYLK
jgi:hypothetical protein